jgi:HprK-related kinase A
LLYADFPVVPDAGFVDVDISIVKAGGIRRWLFPQAYCLARGEQTPVFSGFSPSKAVSFMEWSLNYAIYAHFSTHLILHAAVVERDGRSLLLLGDSGAGKSTLCAALALSGWRLLSDEMALVGLEDGSIYPIVRPVSLKNESIGVIQGFSPEATIGPVCQTDRKGAVAQMRPPADSVRRMDEPAQPHWIVFVSYSAGASLSMEELTRARSFMEVGRSAFNYHKLGKLGFRLLDRVLDQCACRRIQYGDLREAVAHFDSPLYRPE